MRRNLLLDTRIIESVRDAELTLGSVNKPQANPLFGEDKPWERRYDNLYANVIYDEEEQVYKCWYSPFIVSNSSLGMSIQERKETAYTKHKQEMGICYATSKDGISWDKPELGLVEYDGNTANNILWRGDLDTGVPQRGPHGTGIFKDTHDPDPKRRYKALLKSEILSVSFSADGIHWDPAVACPQANSAGDTHNNAFWAPTLKRYVGITRQWRTKPGEYVRLVARTSSTDFVNWEETELVLEGLDTNQQIYTMPVFYHGGVYLGLIAVHDQDTDRVWTELTWSPDTKTWHRVLPGIPLITNDGEEGDYDWGCVYAANAPIFLKDEIRLYYGGSDGLHTSWRNGFLCMATLRPDGFAGYKATQSATVTTTPVFDGSAVVRVSADVANSGELVVQVLGGDNQVIGESEAMIGNLTDAEVSWRDDDFLKEIKPEKARLQFAFKDATVYSFSLG